MARDPHSKSDSPQRPSLVWRRVISVVAVLHLTAVFIAPFRFAATSSNGSPSPPAESVARIFQPYIDATFLNHGYFFFAPNPGPSHLVRYRLTFEDDRPNRENVFPNLREQWPRLLYHRHFMLSETLHNRFVPPEQPNIEDAPELVESWKRERAIYEALWQSFRRRLEVEHGAQHVDLTRVEHLLPTPDQFNSGDYPLKSSKLYVDLSEATSTIPP